MEEELGKTSEGQPMGVEDDPQVLETECGDSHRQKMEKLKAMMIQLAHSNPSILRNIKLIEQKFWRLPLSRIPDHPTYAAMIWRAITELNEDRGSSEEAISRFIEAEYKDLPCAHAGLLHHHLQNLVDKGEIVRASTSCYRLPSANTKSPKVKKGRKQMRRHSKNRKIGKRKTEEEENLLIRMENKSESKEQNIEALPQSKELENGNSLQTWAMELVETHEEEVSGEQSLVEQPEAGVVTEQGQTCKKQHEGFNGPTQGETIANDRETKRIEEENLTHVKGFNSTEEQWKEEEQMKQIKEQGQLNWASEQDNDVIMEMIGGDNSTHGKGFGSSEEQSKMKEQQSKIIKEQGQVELSGEHVEESGEKNEAERKNKMNNKKNQTQEKKNQLQNGLDKQQVGVPKIRTKEQEKVEEDHEVTGLVSSEEEEGKLIQELPYEEKHLSKEIENEGKSQPEDQQIKDFEQQVQFQEMRNQVIEQAEMDVQIEVSKQQKQLQEQQQKLYCDILDLRKMLEQFTNRQERVEAVMPSTSSAFTSQSLDFSGSLLISEEGCVKMLQKANKIEGQLIKIIGIFSEVKARGKQTEFLEEKFMQTTRPCREWNPMMVSSSKIQGLKQGENNGQQKAVSSQSKPMLSSLDAHIDQSLDQQKQNTKIPNLKRPSEVEIATLEQSLAKQRHSNLCYDQRDTFISQSKSLFDKGMKMERQQRILAIKRTEQNIGIGRETDLSGPAIQKKDVLGGNLEQFESENQTENLEGHPTAKPAKDCGWGPDPSKLELVSTTVPTNLDMGQALLKPELNYKPEPPSSEMPLLVGTRSVDESSCPVEQLRCNDKGEEFTCEPVTTLLDSSPVPEQLLVDIQVQESSERFDLAAVDEFIPNQYVKGYLQPEDQGPSSPELALDKTIPESFQSLCQNEQQEQLESREQVNGLKLRDHEDCVLGKPLSSDHWPQHERQQLQHRGRGRPQKPKKMEEVTMEVTMLSGHLKNKQRQKKRGRGRPTKLKPALGASRDLLLTSQHHFHLKEKQPLDESEDNPLKSEQGTKSKESLFLPQKMLQQLPEEKSSSGGRLTKLKAAASLEESLALQNIPPMQPPDFAHGRITRARAAATATLEESMSE